MNRPLGEQLRDYLALRRALGFKLEAEGRLLAQFITYLDEHGTGVITVEDALGWAMLPAAASPRWQARRLSMARRFAAHLHACDPRVEVPPPGLIRGGSTARPLPIRRRRDRRADPGGSALRTRFRAAAYQALISLSSERPEDRGGARLDRMTATQTGHAHRP